MNHTSDQHAWFQASRSDPDGPYGDFYVWSDTDDAYGDARIIFVDTETSNWTFDPVRKQYYWHRFFSHQPDLNYENPAVEAAVLEALRFWLDLGIDGFRCDAVPYLFEAEGTNCENLPATHAFLKRMRAEVDRLYPDTVLLAEANQWPEDVVDYLGDPATGGDEFHMAFHFPADATALHGRAPGVADPGHRDPEPHTTDPRQLPVGHLPAQPRRADPRDGHRRGARLHVGGVRPGPADEGQHRHPPSARTAPGQRPGPDPAVHRTAAVPPRFTGPLLRGRDRDGRQHLAGRPRRRPYADAVDARPQRRLLQRRPRSALRPRGRRPGLRLPGHQRRGAAAHHRLPAELDAADDPRPQGARGLRAGQLHRPRRHQPVGPVLRPCPRRRRRRSASTTCRASRSRSSSTCRPYEGLRPVELTGGVEFPRIGELPYLLTLGPHSFYWFRLERAL